MRGRMLDLTVPITCLLLAEYRQRFHATVVYFDLDGGHYEPRIGCVFETSHLTVRTLEYLVEMIKSNFGSRRKHLVISSPSASAHLMSEPRDFHKNLTYLGFSRWVVSSQGQIPEDIHLSELFQCYALLVNETTVNVPSDFVQCTERRYISSGQIEGVERFTEKPRHFVCSMGCHLHRTLKGHIANNALVWLDFLSASNLSTNPDVQIFDFETTYQLLRSRRKELSLDALRISYGTIASNVYTIPVHTSGTTFVFKRQFQKVLKDDWLSKLFDKFTWIALALYVILQTFSMIVFNGVPLSDAICFVCASLLGQSEQKSARVSRYLMVPLLIAGCTIGWSLKNILKSSFSMPSLLTFDSVRDFRRAHYRGLVDKICVGHRQIIYQTADAKSINPILKVMGEMRDAKKVLDLTSPRDCLDKVVENPKVVALLGFVHHVEFFAHPEMQTGERLSGSPDFALVLPPWSPNEKFVNRIVRVACEARLEHTARPPSRLNIARRMDPMESLEILNLEDLRSVFGAICAAHFCAFLLFLSESVVYRIFYRKRSSCATTRNVFKEGLGQRTAPGAALESSNDTAISVDCVQGRGAFQLRISGTEPSFRRFRSQKLKLSWEISAERRHL